MTKLHIKMPQRPLISIIISTKNEEANLPRLLDSIRGQTYSHYEIIIVDNFSSDSTVSIAKQYTDNVFIKGPERSAQRNFAAHKARGEYLLILDADMELSSDALSTYTHECLSGNYSALSIPERNPSPNFWAKCRDLEKRIARNEKHLVASRFITTRDFLSINGYDGNLVSAEDYDLDDRLRKAGFRIGTSNTVLKHYEDE
ncbi:glycosyltransferase, partial [Patescibacteria group bacterium]|nr:glycosyltransferase [Patescibacteria group bacterium]